MASTMIDFTDEQEKIISKLKDEWQLNKQRTIMKVLEDFKKSKKEVKNE